MKDAFFGLGVEYDTGVQSSIALNERDLVVEVHKSERLSNKLWYRVGKLQPDLNVIWLSGSKAIHYDYGESPAVAINDDGFVVEVHSSQYRDSLFYRVGRIGPDYKIEWFGGSKSTEYGVGLLPKIALRSDNILVVAHTQERPLEAIVQVVYRIGKITDQGKIDWTSGSDSMVIGRGAFAALAVASNDRVAEVNCLGSKLNFRVGTIGQLAKDIQWSEPVEYGEGDSPSVTMTQSGFLIEIHRLPGLQSSLASRVGQCGYGTVQWHREATFFDDGAEPTVACNSRFAIQVHSSANAAKLYWSACRITDRSRWMEQQLPDLGNQTLKTLVLPASHDAAMYVTGSGTFGKTQDLSIGQQLEYGIRYFDLRPSWTGGEFYFYHGFHHVRGASLKDVLSQVALFMRSAGKELVILKFSHYDRFNEKVYQGLVKEIVDALEPWLYETNSRLAEVSLADFLRYGGVVLVLCDEAYPVKQPTKGIYVYRDWDSSDPANGDLRVYDKYSNTTSFPQMQTDQSNKFRIYDARCFYRQDVRCDLFLLSWTLTPPSGVWPVSKEANRHLGTGLARIPVPNPIGRVINLLYVDYVEYSRVTDLSIYLNDFESYAGPLSAMGMPVETTSIVVGVSKDGSLIEKRWSRGISRMNYGPTATGGGLGNALGAISAVRTATASHLFVISSQQHLLHTAWTGSAWSAWNDLNDLNTIRGLAAISTTWTNDNIIVFGLTNVLELVYAAFDGMALGAWTNLGPTDMGGGLWGTLSAIGSPDGSLEIFTISQDHSLLTSRWPPAQRWSGWVNLQGTALGGGLNGGVSALRDGSSIHLFATTQENRILHRRWDENRLSNWEDLGGPDALGVLQARLCAIKGQNPIDIFATSKTGRLLHKAWGGKDWLDWEVVG
jgi:hypothetical protein